MSLSTSAARSLRTEGGEAALMQYYVPFPQLPPHPFADAPLVGAILIRTAGNPEHLLLDVQRLIQGTSPVPVLASVRPYQDLLDPQMRSWRLGANLLSLFGVLALAIAGMGVFSVVSYVVAQRRREIGVRLALGGASRDIVRVVLGDALRLGALGAVAGVVPALALAPLVQPLLFETSARSPWLMLVAVGAQLVVVVLASAIPARRASRTNPLDILRGEG
jgi:hypothetical protein